MRRASSRIVDAAMPLIASAHSGVFACPSSSPSTYAMRRSAPTVYVSRNAGVVQAFGHEHVRERQHHRGVGAGTTGCQVAFTSCWQVGAQRAEQLEAQAAFAAAARLGGSVCRVTPPGLTHAFFTFMPPNATTSSVCSRIAFHVVARRNTSAAVPTTCGRMTSARRASSC